MPGLLSPIVADFKIERGFYYGKWILDHITKENGKWFAEVKNEDITKREHTGDIWGWNGMNYNSLCVILKEYYNISLPPIKELKILKKTSRRTTYILQ